MQHPELPEGEWREKRLQQVWRPFFFHPLWFSISFSLSGRSKPVVTFTSTFNYSNFREELQEFWNPGQCSAQQYEELEGLEDFAYEDEDDGDEFYEDEEAE